MTRPWFLHRLLQKPAQSETSVKDNPKETGSFFHGEQVPPSVDPDLSVVYQTSCVYGWHQGKDEILIARHRDTATLVDYVTERVKACPNDDIYQTYKKRTQTRKRITGVLNENVFSLLINGPTQSYNQQKLETGDLLAWTFSDECVYLLYADRLAGYSTSLEERPTLQPRFLDQMGNRCHLRIVEETFVLLVTQTEQGVKVHVDGLTQSERARPMVEQDILRYGTLIDSCYYDRHLGLLVRDDKHLYVLYWGRLDYTPEDGVVVHFHRSELDIPNAVIGGGELKIRCLLNETGNVRSLVVYTHHPDGSGRVVREWTLDQVSDGQHTGVKGEILSREEYNRQQLDQVLSSLSEHYGTVKSPMLSLRLLTTLIESHKHIEQLLATQVKKEPDGAIEISKRWKVPLSFIRKLKEYQS